MRKLRDNILRIMTSLDMFVSACLLMAYAITGMTLMMVCYYVANLVLLVVAIVYSFDLSNKRSRIEKVKKSNRKIEEDEE